MTTSQARKPCAPRLSEVLPQFLPFARVELQFAESSLLKYRDCARQIERMIGDRPITAYTKEDILALKSWMIRRGNSVNRQISILACLKRILRYAREERSLPALDPDLITFPKRPRKEVVYLTVEEVGRFTRAIPLTTLRDKPCLSGVRFRALCEMLLGSGMRIGELLALDRDQVDFKEREARIVGKGGKEGMVFFTVRALHWLRTYLELRTDQHPALFVTQEGTGRLNRYDIWRPFARYRQAAGIAKRVTPHILRHTAATHLLFNGCSVGHIKEILRHERLETTCRYYLGLDRRAAKSAHGKFLVYSKTEPRKPSSGSG